MQLISALVQPISSASMTAVYSPSGHKRSSIMEKTSVKRSRRRLSGEPGPMLRALDLAKLGDGQVAYIRMMSSDEAQRMFPTVSGLPDGSNIFALHSADGTPLALTDSRQAAVGHALGDRLRVASIH
jgi:hypothetical protein